MKSINLLSILFFFFTIASGQQTFVVGKEKSSLLGEHLNFYIDTTNSLNLEEVKTVAFVPNSAQVLNLSFMPHYLWVKFDVESTSDQYLYLDIDNAMIEELEVYEVIGDSISNQLFAGGFTKPFKDREIQTEKWIFNLDFSNDNQKEIFIKARTGYPFQMPVSIYTHDQYVASSHKNKLFWGIYIGIMLFAFLYNLFILVSLREKTYLYYLLYVVGSTLFYLGLHGYTFRYLYPDWPGLNPVLPVLICVTNIIITLFTLRFLRITRQSKFSFYGSWFLIVGFALIALLNLFGPYSIAIALAQMLSLVTALFFIYLGISGWRKKVPTAKFYLLAWTIYMIFTIIFLLADNNVLPANFFTRHCIFIGHMTEVILLSLALADRINWLKRENDYKQKLIIKQLEENERIQQKANRELEQKVKERTAEVVEQKNEAVKQRERSEELLLNILPAETAEELKLTGKAKAKYVDSATVMFADVEDFSAKAEEMDPTELVHLVNELFTEFDNIIDKYNIEKIKTIGDAYMAVGGLPTPNQTHARDVINAALEIQKRLNEMSAAKEAQGKEQLRVRIGVHTGPVVAGVVGKKKFAYDIWGSTVNIASRLEGAAEVGQVNISESTYELVKDMFVTKDRGIIEVKNIHPLRMYYILDKTS